MPRIKPKKAGETPAAMGMRDNSPSGRFVPRKSSMDPSRPADSGGKKGAIPPIQPRRKNPLRGVYSD